MPDTFSVMFLESLGVLGLSIDKINDSRKCLYPARESSFYNFVFVIVSILFLCWFLYCIVFLSKYSVCNCNSLTSPTVESINSIHLILYCMPYNMNPKFIYEYLYLTLLTSCFHIRTWERNYIDIPVQTQETRKRIGEKVFIFFPPCSGGGHGWMWGVREKDHSESHVLELRRRVPFRPERDSFTLEHNCHFRATQH